jgi:hypothetical protein
LLVGLRLGHGGLAELRLLGLLRLLLLLLSSKKGSSK